MIKNLGEKYSPLYFLASLGFGGMSVFFFMIFMHITPHPDTPMPNFETISAAYSSGDAFMKSAIIVGYIGLIIFVTIHFLLLAWNLREYAAFRKTDAYRKLRTTNAEVTLMAVPLTLGMSINGIFVAALALIPGLWDVLQILMPFALLAYAAVGLLALKTMLDYLLRLVKGEFSFEANGGLNQLLAPFAFIMVAVGFAAPAAMGEATWVVAAGLSGAIFFGVIAWTLALVFLIIGVQSILRYGLATVNSATLWLLVPTITLTSITVLRSRHGLQTLSDLGPAGPQEHPASSPILMIFLATMILAQLGILGIGHEIMRRNGFYRDYVLGREIKSPAAFTLVCPGVGLSVLSMFFINVGLIQNGIVEKFSVGHYTLLGLNAVVAGVTIWLMITLVRNQLMTRPADKAATASAKAEQKVSV
ncbi:TsoY family (seleno)protein [Corynebacterium sp. S7]